MISTSGIFYCAVLVTKPVRRVWSGKSPSRERDRTLDDARNDIRRRATVAALNLLRRYLVKAGSSPA